ncbi:MAG TPA: acetyltransferase [Solirubrobacterales bacterium]|jgi:sugar O-acyltransferase (sialic acid O-acetyltransferase NeuD family)|nr:acetyltransferase [Solirubrobacterales bacterium]
MRVAVYGSRPNGHANVVLDLFAGDHEFVGLLDDRPENAGRAIGELRVLGGTADLPRLAEEGIEGVVLGFGAAQGRRAILAAIEAAGLALPTLVHPTAFVTPSAELAPGAQVMPRASLGPNARVGRGVLVNTGATLDHDVVVADGSVIDPGAVLTGRVRIGSEVEVGSGAVLIPDSVVGDGATVGAGAVVVRPVEAGATVVGVPARPLAKG